MQTVSIREATLQLSRLIEAAVGGEEVIIAEAGQPLVRLVAVECNSTLHFGLMSGEIDIAANFNAPLPDDVQTDFEGQ